MWLKKLRAFLKSIKVIPQRADRRARLSMEVLEDRTTPSVLTVTTSSDAVVHSGTSLRDAIVHANADVGVGISDTIVFAANMKGGDTITLDQGKLLLWQTGNAFVTIDGGGMVTINGNHASGVLQVDGGVQAVLTGVTIENGNVLGAGFGGAIDNQGTLTLSNSTIADNYANVGGGIANLGTLTVQDSTIAGNVANLAGGGIDNQGILTVINSTFDANTAKGQGGGIANTDTLTVVNATLSANGAGTGGGIANNGGALTLLDTIVAGNHGTTDPDVDGNGHAIAGGYNLIGTASGLVGSGVKDGDVNGDLVGHAALLAPPANYGGSTQTLALLPGSPAIGNGGPVATVAQDADTTDQTISVNNAAAIASTPGQYFILIDNEELEVTAVDLVDNTLTVTRGVNGQASVLHQGDPVFLFADQNGVSRASPPDIGAGDPIAPPIVSNIQASTGPTAGGTLVTINGTNLASATAVDFGLRVVTHFVSDSATQIVVNNPAAALGTVNVTVKTAGGISAISPADLFTYIRKPTVQHITSEGPVGGGGVVTITGTDLENATTVDFGTIAATSFISDSATQIVLINPAGTAGTVYVKVVTPGGTSAATPADRFTFMPAPTVFGVGPAQGPTAGGTLVTIAGTNLGHATAVDFGTTVVTSFVSDSATEIVVASPVSNAGTVDVMVESVGGISATSQADEFTFLAAPIVSGIAASTGPVWGGTQVTLTGTNLDNATAVNFGTTSVTTLVSNSDTQIVVASPAGIAGTVDTRVVTAGGTSATSPVDQFTYIGVPKVKNILPSGGPLGGGMLTTITGTNLENATEVDFGSTAVTNFVSDSPTKLVLDSPAGTAGTVDVTVITALGTSATSPADRFSFVNAPAVTGLSTTEGPTAGGQLVTITGTNLAQAAAVDFGPTAVTTFVKDSATTIVVRSAPGNVATFDVTVVTDGGTSPTTTADQYAYIPAPTVAGISSISGPSSGGTPLTITGTNLTGATAVHFGQTAVTSFVSVSDTQIVLNTPASAARLVNVWVATAGGPSALSSADLFTFIAAPVVTGITPAAGPLDGNTTVAITGKNLQNATAVDFGLSQVTSFIVDSATRIVLANPPGIGTVDVTVQSIGGTSALSKADRFNYVAAPTVTGIDAADGPLVGGALVTITGTNLAHAQAVDFGTATVTHFVSDSDSAIVLRSAPGSLGTVDVTVVTVGGTSATSTADQFTYIPVPTVTALSTSTGPASGGTQVTITGTNLDNAAAVYFGKVPVTNFLSDLDTQIVLDSPTSAAGPVNVRVLTAGGPSAIVTADRFTFVGLPVVTAVQFAEGPLDGGETVVIRGQNLANATAVAFGTTVLTNFVSDSNSKIVLVSPAGTGTVDVTVTSIGGTSTTVPADQFTFVAAPTVTGIDKQDGPATGGQLLTIRGTNLGFVQAVDFGTTKVAHFVSASDTQIVVHTPAGTGTVDVTVVTPGGTSATVAADQYTFIFAPVVLNVNPPAGPFVGGIPVTITGLNLDNATAVYFGKYEVTSFISDSDAQITLLNPPDAGLVNVRVVTAGGMSAVTAADRFSYIGAPTITDLSVAAGPTAGGQLLTIQGTNLAHATVAFGPNAATTFVKDSATKLVLYSPPGTGTVNVTVTTAGGTAMSEQQYAYVDAPAITDVDQTTGSVAGGTMLTITGENLANATVRFGKAGAQIISNNGSAIVLVSPPHLAGTVNVLLTTAGGAVLSPEPFTYVAGPSVTQVSPATSSTDGGSMVVINGTNLANAIEVNFGGTPVNTLISDSNTQIVVASPGGVAGTVNVTVETASGTSALSLADRFTYVAAPIVTALNRTAGTVDGGTAVIITGANLANAAVDFGGTPATLVSDSNNRIVVVTPAGSTSGPVSVTVTTVGGTGVSPDSFTFIDNTI